MSDTVVSLLTPPGTGAIATVEVRGARAWELARQLFTPAGNPLPAIPEVNRFWFGTLGSDEVILAVLAADAVEIHCHGGRRVVQWVIDQFLVAGGVETSASGGRKPPESSITSAPIPAPAPTLMATSTVREGIASLGGLTPPARLPSTPSTLPTSSRLGGLTPPARLLQHAPTLRTASILLDQLNGAFANEVRRILALLGADPVEALDPLYRLAELGNTVGRHLVEPWKVVVAGPPNVGKSSLINALAGFQRAVVSDVAGTTRDAVSVQTAFDGWPVELIDTAGIRDAQGLEAEGIDHAKRALAHADLVVWVMDASSPTQVWPDEDTVAAVRVTKTRWVLVMNKCDQSVGWAPNDPPGGIHLSATTGANLQQLTDSIVCRLVPDPPSPGSPIPFTPHLIERVGSAHAALVASRPDEAAYMLREALAESEQHHFASPLGLSS
ncbi:GTPase [Frigoriglobus tundricola]|uniref:GTP-binding protein EngA n=1 Tax=Frigoriglobus tundricola TaxID=2774151 RepID=A0A6M5Z265_9BACT|nr:GTPase [Frigoriglobus tundricola]QJW99531.1 GTP-binding protein EngA [Frigoriglobus tundricola]